MKRKKASKRQKLFVNEWKPLQRMKESVKDNSHDLENTNTTNKILSEFFKNTQKKKKQSSLKK